MHIYLAVYLAETSGLQYVQISPNMPDQERWKDRFKNKFNRLRHSLGRSPNRSPSSNRPITPTLDPQASSVPVAPDSVSIHEIPDTQVKQAPNSPSSSNIYPSIVINPAEDEAPGRMADLVNTGFQGLKTTLQLVEKVASVFPPLKLTVSGLLGVIDIVEVRDFQLTVVTG